jgi:hypothetical protein
MIFANYLSAWIGWIGLIWLIHPRMKAFLGPRPIERINLLAVTLVAISFFLSVIIESGFVHLAIKRARRPLAKALLASLCVNAISYLFICGWFLWVSYSLPFNAHVASLSELGALPRGTLYWVDGNGNVMAQNLDRPGSEHFVERVMQNDFIDPSLLYFQKAADPRRVSLNVLYETIEYSDRPAPTDFKTPDSLVLADAGPANAFPPDYWDRPGLARNNALDDRPPEHRQMKVGFDWYRKYLDTNIPDGPHSNLYIGLTTIEWMIEEPNILPDDKIVFEWEGQIVLFDPHTKKLAFIASGTCPVFIPN